MTHLLLSFVIAGFGVLLVALGLYLLACPRDMLAVRYQNMRLSMTGRPLKDEDFPNLERQVLLVKFAAVFPFFAGIAVLVFAFSTR